MKDFIETNFAEVKKAIDGVNRSDVLTVIGILKKAYNQNKTIYICGNGGSAATAMHMANDLSKGTVYKQEAKKRFKAIDLCSIATWSAWCNDNGYENGFVEQLKNLIQPGDVLIGISGSGNSPNVLKAIEYAKKIGGATIGLGGIGGGKMKDMVDAKIIVPSDSMTITETVHMALDHVIADYLNKWISEGAK